MILLTMMRAPDCAHLRVSCINPYESIRKYECRDCRGFMMCSCNENFGRRYLPHQLARTHRPGDRERIPVTLGFQRRVCNTCRGLPEPACPTSDKWTGSKIKRYYWREIRLQTIPKFAAWAEANGFTDWRKARRYNPRVYRGIEAEVVEEIKALHARSPKYVYEDESDSEVLQRQAVQVIPIRPTRVRRGDAQMFLFNGECLSSPEEVAKRHFMNLGYSILRTQSRPLHVLFGTFMWPLIQDSQDPKIRRVGVGRKLPSGEWKGLGFIWTLMPDDFGSRRYAERRAERLEQHLQMLEANAGKLTHLFNFWLAPSYPFRSYLSAHRSEDIDTARALNSILPGGATIRILSYLIGDYWGRYCGWPDMLVHKSGEFFFVEVKYSSHGFTEDQKHWVHGNFAELRLPYKLIKVHKMPLNTDGGS